MTVIVDSRARRAPNRAHGRRGSRRDGIANAAIVTLRLMLSWAIAAATWGASSVRAEGPAESTSEIRRILVPADRLTDYLSPSRSPLPWPDGGWQAVDRRDFDALLQAAHRTRLPRDAWIESAEYRAVFADGQLQHGTLKASLKHFGTGTRLIPLDSLRLRVSSMRLDGADAVWGATATGTLALLAEPSKSDLDAQWTLLGRPMPRSVEFDVGLLPATVSRMVLQVPDGYDVLSTPGHVEKLGAAGEGVDWLLWRIDLGGHARCQLRIVRVPDAPQFQQPVVLESSETSYVVQESGVEVRQDFQFEALRAPVARLRFLAPSDFEVHSVTYGAESPLPWRRTADRNGQRLDVDLIDPLLGRSRPISVRGFLPGRIGRQWPLQNLTLRTAVSTGERVHVRIARPLVLREVDPGGFRQSRMLADDDGETFTFERSAPGAMPAIDVGHPPSHLSSISISHLTIEGDAWLLAADVTWSGRNGSTFITRCRVPADWNVTDVQVPTEGRTHELLNWKVVPRGNSEQELVIEFPNAIVPGREKTVRVVARRRGAPPGQRIALPTIHAADVLSSEVLLAVSHSNRAMPRTIGTLTLQRTPAIDLPRRFHDSPLLQAPDDGLQFQRSYFFGRVAPNDAGEFLLDLIAPSIDVDADVVARLGASVLAEQVVLNCIAADGPVDRLVVQLSSNATPFTWEIGDKSQSAPIVPRITAGRAVGGDDAAVPDVHEWELRFPEPQSGEFTLVATRSRTYSARDSIALPFVSHARRFRGEVELRIEPALSTAIVPTSLDAVPDATVRKWTYQDPSARLSIRTTESPESSGTSGLASLDLHTVFAPVSGGRDVHLARFVALGTEPETFAFDLPTTADLLEVRVNGQAAQPVRKGDEWVVPPLMGQPMTAIEVHYDTPSQAGRLWTERRIALPKTRHAVVSFRWEFVLPPELRLAEGPQGAALAEPLPNPSLLMRVFGPLGRTSGEPVFNPFLKESWTRLLRREAHTSEATAIPTGRSFAEFPAAQRGTTWHAAAPDAPQVLTLRTWNAHGARLCAWTAFWASLILGLGFRLQCASRSTKPYPSAGAYLFGGCVVVALLAPTVYAEIAGAAVAGCLLSVLLPHALLQTWQFAPSDRHGIRMGSTISAPQAIASLLLIAMLWAANAADAQEASTLDAARTVSRPNGEATAPSKLQDLRVLVPVGRDLQPAASAPFVYATHAAEDRLRQLAQRSQERIDYLILSADYDGIVDDRGTAVMTADYRIVVLDCSRATRVHLPIQGAHLGGPRECLVDGEPTTVVRNGQQGAFVIDVAAVDAGPAVAPKPVAQDDISHAIPYRLDAAARSSRNNSSLRRSGRGTYRIVEVRLQLRPTVAEAANLRGFEVSLPPSANGSLSLEFSRTGLDVLVTGRADETSKELLRSTNTSGRVSCPLGRANHVSVTWSDSANDALDVAPAVAAVEAACFVEARPSQLTLYVRANYALKSGTVDYVVWRIPRDAIPRRVAVDETEVGFTMTEVRGANADCMIELPGARNVDFTVTARFTLPVPSVRTMLSLPAFNLFATPPDPGSVGPVEAVPLTCAISAAPNYQIVGVQGGSADFSLRMMIPEAFSEWARELGIREPNTVVELSRPTSLKIELKPIAAERTVNLRQTGTVAGNSLEWTVEADVDTSLPGVFQHTLQIDERLDVESVSVTEDQAERLVRWSLQGRQIVLYLSGRTAGRQTVKLVGRMPCPPGEDVTLPSIRFLDAKITRSRLWLQHGGDVELTVIGLPKEVAGPGDAAVPADVAGPLHMQHGPFELNDEVAPMQVRVVPQIENVDCEIVSLLEQRTGGRWELTQVFDFGRTLSPGSHVVLVIPPDLAEGIEFLPEGLQQEAGSADGRTRFVVIAGPVPAEGYRIVATARHLQPAPDGPWNVPHASVLNADESAHFLLLLTPGLFVPENDVARSVDHFDLPEWFPFDRNENVPSADWKAFRVDGKWPRLVPSLPQEQDEPAQVPLFETQMWLTDSGKEYGESVLLLLHPGAESILRLSWPHACRLRGLTIDGRRVAALEPEGGTFVIPLNPGRPVQIVRVYWDHLATEELTHFGNVLMSYPSPKDLTVGTSLLTLHGPATRHVMPRGGFQPTGLIEHSLERMNALISTLRGAPLPQRDRWAIWSLLEQESLVVEHELARLPSQENDAWNSNWQRYRKLTAQMASLRPAALPERSIADSVFPIGGAATFPANAERALFGDLPSGDPVPTFSAWVIDETVLTALTAALCLLVVLPVARTWVSWRRNWWGETRAWTAWVILALIWWTCLTPSIVGLLLLPCAAWFALRRPQARLETSEFLLRPSSFAGQGSTSGLQSGEWSVRA